ncbi:regulator of chromosome condensation, RCC1 [Labilithrix luteola]|uniref:Regulator of chromosome condensation, RCC1 n=1 Tax=Labilithrix luteola TaxID=1391654 RepID=A0A0K1Q270_9BACT|nr:hypothetical protein [Labilithrix luteola]AKU99479.1 regulator of chromosome condensation, RCC1 [Labilithrix luteola]
MKRLHATWFVLGVLAVGMAGCADDEPTEAVDADAGERGSDASLPETGDASTRAPFDPTPPTIACATSPCITKLVAGPNHYCATASDGTVRCWGKPSAIGSFATGASGGDPGATPVVLTGIQNVLDIGASSLRTCIVTADGAVSCFGSESPAPTPVAGVEGATRLAVGEDRSCAVLADGRLTCWGDSAATGKGSGVVSLGSEGAAGATMASTAAFAIGSAGTLYSWGSDPYMLGRESSLAADWTPLPVQGIGTVLQVAASDQHACALTADGHMYCWGRDDHGALGLGAIRNTPSPTEVLFAGTAWPAQIAAALTHSCVRMTNGDLNCWARTNTSGELGYSELTGVFIPTKVGLTRQVAAVATGTGSTCALVVDGSVLCWGDNTYGQLGLGKRDASRHPEPTTVVFP